MLQAVQFSKFDHVGIILRYNNGTIALFESIADKGVCRWDWQGLQRINYWKNNYAAIKTRRLLGIKRDEEF
jgi:hypothetical protein